MHPDPRNHPLTLPMADKPTLKHFPKIREARELLLAQAEELIQLKLKIIKDAMAIGQFDVANKAADYLLEHMPPDSKGISILAPSIDKSLPEGSGSKAPQIQIGIALGGITPSLPTVISSPVIDVKAIEASDETKE